MTHSIKRTALSTAIAFGIAGFGISPAMAWEPTKPVELVIPAGPGGGADQMARMIRGIIQKPNLREQPLVVVNKGGGAAGACGHDELDGLRGLPCPDAGGKDAQSADGETGKKCFLNSIKLHISLRK